MKKLMIGMAAISMLVSCGLTKTPPIELVSKERPVKQGDGAGGGALGIDGKGRPISLATPRLGVQAVSATSQFAIGTFEDSIVSNDAKQYLDRLDTWGASQDIGFKDATIADAVLAPNVSVPCPSSFELSGLSATLLLTDDVGVSTSQDPSYVPVSGSLSVEQTFAVPGIVEFTAMSGKPCEYKMRIKGDNSGKKPELNISLGSDKLGSLKNILKDGKSNYARIKLSYDNAIVRGDLTVYFGASSAYVIGIVI
jgi:hypothetical protein